LDHVTAAKDVKILRSSYAVGVVLIVCATSFQDFQPTWSQYTNLTDRQMDNMRLQDRDSPWLDL